MASSNQAGLLHVPSWPSDTFMDEASILQDLAAGLRLAHLVCGCALRVQSTETYLGLYPAFHA